MTTILCYGDSNTHGTPPTADHYNPPPRLPLHQRWVGVLAAELGPRFNVIAEGLPGRTTVHDDPIGGPGRNGLTLLSPILNSHKPIDLLVLMLGTNDLQRRYQVGATEIARAHQRLIEAANASSVVKDILIIAPVPIIEAGPWADDFAGGERRQHGLAAALKRVAAHYGCGFFDAGDYARVSSMDGLHLDADAHAAIGHAVSGVIGSRLSQLQAPRET
ncbi:SGNH/GDSL hydrolase family protein [Gammaproteobacteria bacterium]|nr:SGNH/GDSL hydrolase family protein [Gammaproteobacteria bacterium]